MKGTVLALICAISVAKGGGTELNQNGCPLDPYVEKLIPHRNCNQFYQCHNGELVVHTCAKVTFYNPDILKCDWPENVDCGDRVIPEDNDSENDNSSDNDNGGDDNENDEVDIDNGGGDNDNGVGDNDNGGDNNGEGGNDNGDSGNDNGGNGGNDDPSEAGNICATEGSNDVLVAHENCNQFNICYNGKPVVKNCPANLLFNPAINECDWPKNVNCGDRVIPEDNDSENDNNSDNDNGGDENENDEVDVDNGGGDNDNGGDNNGDSGNDNGGNGGNDDPSEAGNICATEGSNDVLVAHENCNQFYICYNAKPVVMNCPANLLFNPAINECDWPKNVNCGDRVIPEDNDSENDNNSDNDNGGDDNENDEVDVDNGGGDNDNDGDNNGEGGTDNGGNGGNDDPSEAGNICASEGSNDVLVAHENCNQFYICYNGKPVVMNCPANLLFNPASNECDWPKNVNCGDRVIPEDNDSENDNNSDNDNGEDDNENDEVDVDNGGGDNDNGGDNNGDSGNDNGGNGGNDDPSEAGNICATEGSNDVLVAHENCNQFYICYNAKPVVMNCPANLLFNPAINECDWPKNVNCGDRVIPEDNDSENDNNSDNDNGGDDNENDEVDVDNGGGGNDNGGDNNGDSGNDNGGNGGNDDPSEAGNICATEGSNDVLVAHENCNQFYICYNAKPVVMNCPANLLFNPAINECDWPKNVNCGDRVIPEDNDSENDNNSDNDNGGDDNENDEVDVDNGGGDNDNDGDNNGEGGTDNGGNGGNDDPSEAGNICASEGSNDVLVAHENCNQFYICYNGKPVVMNCPANLLFNPAINECDWPKIVNCGDRIIPEDNDSENDNNSDNDNGGDDNENGEVDVDNGGGDNDNDGDNNGEGGTDNGGNGGNDDPSEAGNICASEGSNDVLVAHENCNQFYICYNGKPVVMNCPANLLFNPAINECDWPKNVNCGDRVIPEDNDGENDNNSDNDNGGDDNENGEVDVDNGGGDNDNDGDNNGEGGTDNGGNGGNDDPSEAGNICASEGSNDVLVAHENCNQFYICYNGKPVVMNCPANLLFNPAIKECDWPKNVNCGDRVIPEDNDGENDNNSDNDNGGDDNENGEVDVDNGGGDNDNDGDNNGEGGSDNDGNGGNDDPSEAGNICASEGSNDVLVAHENCNQFYICHNGKPVVMNCPANLLFNPAINECDWPKKVNCGDRVIPEDNDDGSDIGGDDNENGEVDNDNSGSDNGDGENDNDNTGNGGNDDPSEAANICAAEDSNDILVAHDNCNQFYICHNGKPVVMNCPANLLFNPAINECDWPKQVNCGDRVIPEENDDENDDGSDNDNGGEDNENDEVDIDNGGGNNENGGGDNDNDEDNNGEGGNDNGGNNGNDDPSEAGNICASEGSNDVLVAHENCNQFYICHNGKPVVLNCPTNLLFNPAINECDWPKHVNCGDRVIPEENDDENDEVDIDNGGGNNENGGGDDDNDGDNNGEGGNDNGDGGNDNGGNNGNNDPNEAGNICASEGSNDVLVAHENCNQFYICHNGKPVVMNCPANLLFNPAINECDWPKKVNCGDRVIPEDNDDGSDIGEDDNENGEVDNDNGGSDNGDGENDNDNTGNGGNDDPSEAGNICAAEDSNDILVAHENCNQFYICHNGKPVVMNCPANLLFNPAINECGWPKKVNCGDRVIPEENDDENDNGSDNDNGGDDNENDEVDIDNNENGGGDNGNDGDNNGEGGNDNGVTDGNDDPSEAANICAAEDSNDILVAHKNCNQFFICHNGKPVVMNCPVNLLFNPAINKCDWPRKVNCGDRVILEDNDGDNNGKDRNNYGGNGNDDPSQAAAICGKADSNGILVAHENCNMFYKCSYGEPVALSCQSGLLYNPGTEQCDWPQNVECGVRAMSYFSINKHMESRRAWVM